MSKPRYNWWSFMLAIIRDYPARRMALKELRQQKITASPNATPGGGTASRVVENVSLRQLQPQEQKEHDTVYAAILRTRAMKEGKIRLNVVKLTFFQSYTIAGAAMRVNISERSARRYRWEFVLLCGHLYGLLTEEEYRAALKRDVGKKLDSQGQ